MSNSISGTLAGFPGPPSRLGRDVLFRLSRPLQELCLRPRQRSAPPGSALDGRHVPLWLDSSSFLHIAWFAFGPNDGPHVDMTQIDQIFSCAAVPWGSLKGTGEASPSSLLRAALSRGRSGEEMSNLNRPDAEPSTEGELAAGQERNSISKGLSAGDAPIDVVSRCRGTEMW